MWKWTAGISAVIAVAVLVVAMRAAARRRRGYQTAIRLWQETAPQDRRKTFERLIEGNKIEAPAWYLLGCAYLREGRPRLAARAFGVAHHADYTLETAALLTFACLKATEGPDSNIVEQMIRTWHEMRKPDLLRRHSDRLMLEGLASAAEPPPPLSPLGRLIWLTVPPPQQEQVRSILANGDLNAKTLQPTP